MQCDSHGRHLNGRHILEGHLSIDKQEFNNMILSRKLNQKGKLKAESLINEIQKIKIKNEITKTKIGKVKSKTIKKDKINNSPLSGQIKSNQIKTKQLTGVYPQP